MTGQNPGNFVLAAELRAIADLCDTLNAPYKDGAIEVSFGDIPVIDANGEGIGFVKMVSCGQWGFDPWC
jgi:hypothetical protein